MQKGQAQIISIMEKMARVSSFLACEASLGYSSLIFK